MKTLKIILLIALFIIGLIGALVLYDKSSHAQKNRVQALLALTEVPHSVQNVECKDWGMTDILVACYFEIDPRDLKTILSGYFKGVEGVELNQYAKTHLNLTTYSDHVVAGPKVGPEFKIGHTYRVNPGPSVRNGYPSFEHGGVISLYTNAENTKVVFDYYEE